MRLDDEDFSSNIERQSGGGNFAGFGGGGGGLGLLGMLVPFVLSRFGCGGLVVLAIGAALFGLIPGIGGGGGGSLLGGGQQAAPAGQQQSSSEYTPVQQTAARVLGSTERRWTEIFGRFGQQYPAPKMVFYDGQGVSGCGAAQSAMGPFYCPTDQKLYIDTTFFEEMASRYGAGGDFPIGYIIAHEVGHHIQTIDGTADKVRAAQARASKAEGNALQVRMELQADCYAGVWAAYDKNLLEAGDVEEGLRAAQAIGDDTLQRAAQGRVVPESFTHGTAAQRQTWLKRGLDTGDPRQCDTFAA